jgi:hypothetical protein
MNGVPTGAELGVSRLQVETGVEIECRAVLVELGADSGTVGKNEVDLFPPRQEGAPDHSDGDAPGALTLDPFELLNERAWLDRHAKYDLVLHDEARHRLLDHPRLRGNQAEQHGDQSKESRRIH